MILPTFIAKREQGFALVTVLLILMVLTLLGIMATNNTTTELRIAGNDKVHKQTFYQADGGTELAERLVFENTICSQVKNGFSNSGLANPLMSRIVVFDQTFADSMAAPGTIVRMATEAQRALWLLTAEAVMARKPKAIQSCRRRHWQA